MVNMNIKDRKTNRLIHEKSPYLLQHAYNPIDWYSWSEEAFERAKTEDKPVFMSLGYSSCHWCHVMERESFEDAEVAELLNRNFVSIKVDREERPDIDHIYMNVCQALTGHGGWPLTIIMTPDKEPFFAATYLPKGKRGGMSGLMDLLPRIAALWKDERQRVLNSVAGINEWLQKENTTNSPDILTTSDSEKAFADMSKSFDKTWGGFGSEPKFPSPHNLLFLLRYYYFKDDVRALGIVEKTLDSMYKGGIYDHIGFGFARYSTDRQWLIPHFEKMLYDNALLAMAYLESYQVSGKELYAQVAGEIFSYIMRDMTSPEGGFYSAEDADSEGEEGKYYTWTQEEVLAVLGDAGHSFCEKYDISLRGNFEGRNIPNLIKNSSLIYEYTKEGLEESRQKLFNYREQRVHPFKDDKILTGWNGLMIAALAMGARILGNLEYQKAAQKGADFIWTKLRREDGRLLARYRDGEAAYPAYASDYAYLIWGLIELYEASFDCRYLKRAVELNNDLLRYFWDTENAGLFFYGVDGEKLIIRPKDDYDGALPSANAVAALNFLRLARITGNNDLHEKVEQQIGCFSATIKRNPSAYSFWQLVLMNHLYPAREVVLVTKSDKQESLSILNSINSQFNPNLTTVLKVEESDYDLTQLIPFIKEMNSISGQATAYVCEGYSCQQPVTDMTSLFSLLEK